MTRVLWYGMDTEVRDRLLRNFRAEHPYTYVTVRAGDRYHGWTTEPASTFYPYIAWAAVRDPIAGWLIYAAMVHKTAEEARIWGEEAILRPIDPEPDDLPF